MKPAKSILFATDLFLTGDKQLQAIARLSQLFGARISLFHVLKRHTDLHTADLRLTEKAWTELVQLRDKLAALGAEVVVLPVEFGDVTDAILRHANAVQADLIVMGAGRHFPSAPSASGVSVERVVERAHCPVLAISPDSSEQIFNKKILCPVDHSANSNRGLKNAIRLAQLFGSELIVLNVIPRVSWLQTAMDASEPSGARVAFQYRWRQKFDRYLAGVDFGEVSWQSEVRNGDPHQQIVAAAIEHQVEMIVMGGTDRTGLVRAVFGSVTQEVLHRLPCSILVLKDEDLVDEITEEDAKVSELLLAEAEALLDVQSFDLAVEKLDQVLSHDPFHERALLRRAAALQQLGQIERADRSWRRAAAVHQVRSFSRPQRSGQTAG